MTTTPTSVKFTVTSNHYFDPKGSTITFSTFKKGGYIYVRVRGIARSTTNPTATTELIAAAMWAGSALRFKGYLRRIAS